MAGGARSGLVIQPLTAARADDVKTITRGTWGTQCWDLFYRFTNEQKRELFGGEAPKEEKERRRREALVKLTRRRHAPVLVAYAHGEPAGFVSARAATTRMSSAPGRCRASTTSRCGPSPA